MKRKVIWLTALSLITLLILAQSALGVTHGLLRIPGHQTFIDDEEKTRVPAINLKGRTMVPLRFIEKKWALLFSLIPMNMQYIWNCLTHLNPPLLM